MVEFWYRKVFRHYNEVFVETANTCAIFRCFEQTWLLLRKSAKNLF
ncbi:hypothetical protein T01_8029 [Trichinella spiralis]|uniref:Uncharacterized protein n=1 Tax=Trichinella spiralis TaxID=6334 RepID=A0A0V1AM11_TRISP|nr:hypothetical protein T01_8029 [Trichinella spiralis]